MRIGAAIAILGTRASDIEARKTACTNDNMSTGLSVAGKKKCEC